MDRRRGTLLAVILGSAIVFLDSTVVNVALLKIGEDLPSHLFGALEGETYVYNAYLLTLSALLVVAGALADVYGRRRMFAVGLAGFGVTSVLCGLAPSLEILIVFRIAQGAAGALLVPGSLAILTAAFEGEDLGRAFGLWAGVSAAMTILGPLVGGLLVQTISWRAAFFVNVPLVLIALWATWRSVSESRSGDARPRFDWAGAAAAGIAIGGLSFGAIYGQQREWKDPVGPAALAVGALALVAFLVMMARGRHPLVPLGMFRSRNFAVTNLSTFLIYGALYVFLYEQATFSQGTLGYTAAAAGMLSIPGSVLLAVLSPRIGVLGARYGPRRFMVAGPTLMAAGLLWQARIPAGSPAWVLNPGSPASWIPPAGYFVDFLPTAILFGGGLALMVAPLTTALMTSVPARNAGLGSAINNAISRVGPQLAGAAIFVAITAAFYGDLASRIPGLDVNSSALRLAVAPLQRPDPSVGRAVAVAAQAASTDAFHVAVAVAAGLLLLGALANAIGIRDSETSREPATSGPETQAAAGSST